MNSVICADANQDGRVDEQDLFFIEMRLGNSLLSEEYCPSADVNGDGVVDEVDLELIRMQIYRSPRLDREVVPVL